MQVCESTAIAAATKSLTDLFRNRTPVDRASLDSLVDTVIGLDEIETTLEAFAKDVSAAKAAVSFRLAELFIENEQNSVTRRGKTVYIAREYWPGPKFTDLLPEGVDPKNPDYEATVAKCREAAKERLLMTLKESANFSGLVVENYNAASLRSALTGKDAERDELDVPILPPELAEIVELNPKDVVRVRKAGK